MKLFRNLSLSQKLILIMAAISIIPAVVIGYMSYTRASTALQAAATAELTSVRDLKQREVATLYNSRFNDLKISAATGMDSVLQEFAKALEKGGIDGKAYRELVAKHDKNFSLEKDAFAYADLYIISKDVYDD